MRILYLAEQLSAGGAEYLFLRKARYFKDRGHDVFVASGGGPLEERLRHAGIPHILLPTVAQFRPDVPYQAALEDARRLERLLRRERIEVVDAVPIRPFLMAHHVAGRAGIPVFLECLSPTHFVPIKHAPLARAAADAGLLVAMDPDDAAGSCPRLGIDLGKVRVIPNPIDTTRFRPGPRGHLRAELGAAEGDFVVLSASRLDPDKAGYVRMLLDDFADLAARDPGAWFAIAGDGTERAALEAAVAARRVPRVRFLGMRADLERLYPGADAFVGMGTTVLEAAACGVAVVVANALTLRQGAVDPEEAAMAYFGHLGASTVGYRVPRSEPGTFLTYLGRLRNDPGFRTEVAREALEMAVSRFGMDRVLGEWESAYRQACVAVGTRDGAHAAAGAGAADGPGGGVVPAVPIEARILFVTRPDAFANPGGDTVQLLRTREALARLGVNVDISVSTAPDARGYDVVHVFNLQLAGLARSQMDAARSAGVPAVVSPIFWDHAELDHFAPRLRRVFTAAPDARGRLLDLLEADAIGAPTGGGPTGSGHYTPSRRLEAQRAIQRQVASEADLLLPNSSAEAETLRLALGDRIAPGQVVPNGIDPGILLSATPDAFVAKHGLRDFVLAAARWDDRKNLLMLCEAVRGTDLPLVLIGGRPNAEYEQLVRSVLPPGTLVLDTVSQDELASAYSAARVHALPSWFETPGLSSLEAAVAGCAIVVGDRGAEREYFGDGAYYCDPASVTSIRQAILAAWKEFEGERPRRAALRERILRDFTWDRAGAGTIEAYERVLGGPILRHGGDPEPEGATSTRERRLPAGPTGPSEGPPLLSVDLLRVPEGPVYGIRVADAIDASSADVIVLVAPGATLPEGAAAKMAAWLAADPGVAAIGPVSDGGAPLQHVALYLPPEAITGRADSEIAEALALTGRGPVRADLLSRFCLAIRRAALVAAGGWDAALAPEHAELDVSWRLRRAGHRLAIAPDVFVRSVPRTARPDDPDLRESADRLAGKLETGFGRGRVPRPEALWGVATFLPSVDLWGPRPTRFRMVAGPSTEPSRDRVLAAFGAAFGPGDPVALDLVPGESAEPVGGAGGDAGGERHRGGAAGPDAAELAAEAVAGRRQDRGEQIVDLVPGASVPGHDSERVTPELLRQVVGFRPRPGQRGLTSIVLLAVDQRDYAKLCLDTLYERTLAPFELIVVDGGVGERTRQVIASFADRHPGLIWLRTGRPESASHLFNLGLAAAEGDYVALLKGDAVVTHGWLTYLLGHLDADPSAALVGPRSNGGPGCQPLPELPYDAVPEMAEFARALAREKAGAALSTNLVGTFALVMRRDTVTAIGGFDPGYPSGTFEAPDFCLRTLLAGRRILLAEDVFVHHFGLQPPAVPETEGPVFEGLKRFRERWGPLPEAPDADAMQDLRQIWAGRTDLPPAQALPSRRGLPLVVKRARVEGAKERNLLLVPDWGSDPRPWENTIRQYAATFDGDSPVALMLPGATETILQRIASILGEARPDGNSPDILVLEDSANLAGIVAASQGVVSTGAESNALMARLAEILEKPILGSPDAEDLLGWALGYT